MPGTARKTTNWSVPTCSKSDGVDIPVFGRDPASQRLLLHYPGHSPDAPAIATGNAYRLKLEDGTLLTGLTDASGVTQMIEKESMQRVEVSALRDGGS